MRAGSIASSRASCQASDSVASAACAENDAVRTARDGIDAGSCSEAISAPRNDVCRCRPGRAMTEKAGRPSISAAAKASFPFPTALVTPRPEMIRAMASMLREAHPGAVDERIEIADGDFHPGGEAGEDDLRSEE